MTATHRYIVPRPRGVTWAVGSREPHAARSLILHLLAGAAELPMDLPALGKRIGVGYPEEIAKLVLKLQRESYLICELAPMAMPAQEPFSVAISDCLSRLALSGTAVLATDGGLCYGRAGASPDDSQLISSTAARMFAMRERLRQAMRSSVATADAVGATGAYVIEDLQLMPIHTGSRLFYLVTLGQPDLSNGAYVALVSMLLRRYQSHATN
ncbi:MAG: hypothetical protein JNJ60_12230 [Rhodocyclaceae bacterium]|nr:hypothetical protein [Rhodocyclaceae bacterium]